LDLRELRINELILQIGAGTALVNLPSHAGRTIVRIKASAAALTLHVPPQVAARIVTKNAIASADVDLARFPRSGKSTYQSADYATAANRLDIYMELALGSAEID
jgi:hypothetical protein